MMIEIKIMVMPPTNSGIKLNTMTLYLVNLQTD